MPFLQGNFLMLVFFPNDFCVFLFSFFYNWIFVVIQYWLFAMETGENSCRRVYCVILFGMMKRCVWGGLHLYWGCQHFMVRVLPCYRPLKEIFLSAWFLSARWGLGRLAVLWGTRLESHSHLWVRTCQYPQSYREPPSAITNKAKVMVLAMMG